MQISFAALSCSNLAALSCSNLAALSCSNLAALSCSNLAAHCLLQPCGLCVFRMQISLICYICNLYLYHIQPFCNLPIYLYPQLRTVTLLPLLEVIGGGLVQGLGPQISNQGVPGSSPGRCAICCGLEQVTFTPCLVLVKPRKRWTHDRLGQTVTRLETMLCLMY